MPPPAIHDRNDLPSGSRSGPVPLCPISPLPGTGQEAHGSALVVNIFGGPGTGKTVLASDLFSALKKHDVEAACPEEHAKLALRSGQPWLLDQQVILLGRTWETLQSLADKVEVILVDSPLLLCSVYAGEKEPSAFHGLALDLHRRHRRINLLLCRNEAHIYSTNGRRENESEARTVDVRISEVLTQCREQFTPVTTAPADLAAVVSAILTHSTPSAFAT